MPRLTEDDLQNIPEKQRRLCLDIDADVDEAEFLCADAFPGLTRFVAVQMLVDESCGLSFGWKEITRILGWMPALKELCVAYNPVSANSIQTSSSQVLRTFDYFVAF